MNQERTDSLEQTNTTESLKRNLRVDFGELNLSFYVEISGDWTSVSVLREIFSYVVSGLSRGEVRKREIRMFARHLQRSCVSDEEVNRVLKWQFFVGTRKEYRSAVQVDTGKEINRKALRLESRFKDTGFAERYRRQMSIDKKFVPKFFEYLENVLYKYTDDEGREVKRDIIDVYEMENPEKSDLLRCVRAYARGPIIKRYKDLESGFKEYGVDLEKCLEEDLKRQGFGNKVVEERNRILSLITNFYIALSTGARIWEV